MKKYKASKNYILRTIADEAVLVSVGDGVADFCGVIKLNATAKLIWMSLQQGTTRDELIKAISDIYPVEIDRVTDDIDKTLSMLENRGMITVE